MPEFRRSRSEMDAARIKAAGATAPLPGLDMKVVHQRAVAGKADQIFIALNAPPVEARAAATDRRESIAFAAERGSACNGASLRLKRLG
jgi:hypothetical protein